MHETIIEPGRSERQYWSDLIRFRELLWILAKRDITVRYKQTLFGVAWAVVRPILTVVVFIFAFHKVAKIQDTSGVNFNVIIFTGVIFWNFFATSFQQVSHSITGNANLVAKVYFPRLLMPLSAIAVPLIDFLVAFVVVIPFLLYNDIQIGWQLLVVPFFLLISFLLAFGLGLIFASFNVQYLDFQQILPLVVQYGFFICPVAYSTSSLSNFGWFDWYMTLNPMASLLEGFRWALIPGYPHFQWIYILYTSLFVVFLVILAIYLFRKKENSFVDYI